MKESTEPSTFELAQLAAILAAGDRQRKSADTPWSKYVAQGVALWYLSEKIKPLIKSLGSVPVELDYKARIQKFLEAETPKKAAEKFTRKALLAKLFPSGSLSTAARAREFSKLA